MGHLDQPYYKGVGVSLVLLTLDVPCFVDIHGRPGYKMEMEEEWMERECRGEEGEETAAQM